MQQLGSHGITNFLILAGYKGEMIKDYFSNFEIRNSDFTIDLQSGELQIHNSSGAPWTVTVLDTGDSTQTGGRLKRAADFLEEVFLLTYGDGLADIDVRTLIDLHKQSGKIGTVSAVRPPARFGALEIDPTNRLVTSFQEKVIAGESRISGGYFIFNRRVLEYLTSDETVLEQEPLRKLVADCELLAFEHDGFWAAMDTLRDKNALELLWNSKKAPWKTW